MSRGRGIRSASRGFTLIEILLVVILVGILMGVTALTMNPSDPDRRLLAERDRLQGDILLLRLLAESDQVELGVRLAPESLTFLRFQPRERRWQVIRDEATLKSREVPGILFNWRDQGAAGAPVTPAADGNAGPVPDFLLLSNGEATPGVIQLRVIGDERRAPRELVLTDSGDVFPAETLSERAR